MSKNPALENLVNELKLLPETIEDSFVDNDESIILARMLQGVSREKWLKACKKNKLSNWHAIPAEDANANWQVNLPLKRNRSVSATSFRKISGVITHDMFLTVLERELKRISRNGGSLSILSFGLVDRKRIKENFGASLTGKLETLLASVMLDNMENCDSLGILRKGQFLCCMPGIGQLAARSFAEKTQSSFEKQQNSVLSDKTGNVEVNCAAGIVNLLQGENYSVSNLIRRCATALEMAISRPETYIYQEAPLMPLENTTLVQSSEKRFLFFGE